MMRDDFSDETKRIIAALAGGVCSNPECHAATSGPQEDTAKALNLGVAAHITSAAPGGPRYDPSLSAQERSHPDNGIWLCQTCAKLVDNDVLLFPEDVLRAMKTLAEHRARASVGRTALPVTESESQRKLHAIIPWKSKLVTLSEMNTGRAVMLIGPVRGSSWVHVLDCTEFYVTVGKTGPEAWSRSISLKDIEISFDNANNRLELQERHV